MVYETDFYTTRRGGYRPSYTSYSVTSPRHYIVSDTVGAPRRAEEAYSYSYKSTSERSSNSSNPSSYSRPSTSSYSSTTERRSTGGPGGYSYTSERSSSSGGPGGYSYSSSLSGSLPGGTKYRHYSYRV